MQNLVSEFLSNRTSGEVTLMAIGLGVVFLFLGVKVGQMAAHLVNML